jgi:cobalt-zinc-cadmium efflux system membrane fusion protein
MESARLVFLALAVALALPGCHRTESDESAGEPKVADNTITFPAGSPAVATIKMTVVAPAASTRLTLNGRIVFDDDHTARIFAPFAGRVERLTADVSDRVQAGQTLAYIASPDYAQAQADAGKAVADAALAERNATRLHELLAHGAAAEKDVQAADADLARARAEKARAENTLKMRAGAVIAPDGEPLFPLNTPFAGVVVERNVNPGQEVRPDQMLANAPQFFAPLFVVSDPTRMWVFIDATEHDLPLLQRGARFTVHSAAFPDTSFEGTVTWIADALDPTTRMVRVRGVVGNPDRRLKAEMFVSVDFDAPAAATADVPATGVFMKGSKHYAYVAEAAGVFRRREVQVAGEHDGKIEIAAGVRPGDRIVTDGALLLDEIYSDASSGS